MTNGPNLALRLNDFDRAALREVATRLQRSQSDTVRVLVRTALEVLREQDAGSLSHQPAEKKQSYIQTKGSKNVIRR